MGSAALALGADGAADLLKPAKKFGFEGGPASINAGDGEALGRLKKSDTAMGGGPSVSGEAERPLASSAAAPGPKLKPEPAAEPLGGGGRLTALLLRLLVLAGPRSVEVCTSEREPGAKGAGSGGSANSEDGSGALAPKLNDEEVGCCCCCGDCWNIVLGGANGEGVAPNGDGEACCGFGQGAGEA